MSVNSRLKATKTIGQRKAFCRQIIQSLAVGRKKLLTQTSLREEEIFWTDEITHHGESSGSVFQDIFTSTVLQIRVF